MTGGALAVGGFFLGHFSCALSVRSSGAPSREPSGPLRVRCGPRGQGAPAHRRRCARSHAFRVPSGTAACALHMHRCPGDRRTSQDAAWVPARTVDPRLFADAAADCLDPFGPSGASRLMLRSLRPSSIGERASSSANSRGRRSNGSRSGEGRSARALVPWVADLRAVVRPRRSEPTPRTQRGNRDGRRVSARIRRRHRHAPRAHACRRALGHRVGIVQREPRPGRPTAYERRARARYFPDLDADGVGPRGPRRGCPGVCSGDRPARRVGPARRGVERLRGRPRGAPTCAPLGQGREDVGNRVEDRVKCRAAAGRR